MRAEEAAVLDDDRLVEAERAAQLLPSPPRVAFSRDMVATGSPTKRNISERDSRHGEHDEDGLPQPCREYAQHPGSCQFKSVFGRMFKKRDFKL